MLQKLRELCEYTQHQVATAININRKTYSNYESGISEMGIETVKKLAKLYGIPSSLILGEPDLIIQFMEEIENDKL
ncbi:helix-turn-helix transcriptional regulator [Vagococcus lutrae]|nr:helix-turn-helix transcriptional regulator [Vagococcus lutrae]